MFRIKHALLASAILFVLFPLGLIAQSVSEETYPVWPDGIGPVRLGNKVSDLPKSAPVLYDDINAQLSRKVYLKHIPEEGQDITKGRFNYEWTVNIYLDNKLETYSTKKEESVISIDQKNNVSSTVARHETNMRELLCGQVFDVDTDENGLIKRIQIFDPRFKTASGLNANSTLMEISRVPGAQIVFQMDGVVYAEADGVKFQGFTVFDRAKLEELRYNLSLDLEGGEGRYKLSDFIGSISRNPDLSQAEKNRLLSYLAVNNALYIELVKDVIPVGYSWAKRTLRIRTSKVKITEVECEIKDRTFFQITPFGLGPVLVGKNIKIVDEFFRLHYLGLLFENYILQRDRFLVFEAKYIEEEDITKQRFYINRKSHLLDKKNNEVLTTSCRDLAFILYEIRDDGEVEPKYEVPDCDENLEKLLQGKVMDICIDEEGNIVIVRIYDPRFCTASGLNANSSMWDIYKREDAEIVFNAEGVHLEADGVCFYGFMFDMEDIDIEEMRRELGAGPGNGELRLKAADLMAHLLEEQEDMTEEDLRLTLATLLMNRADYIEIKLGYHAAGFEAMVELRRTTVEEQEEWVMRYGYITLYIDSTEWIRYHDIELEPDAKTGLIWVKYMENPKDGVKSSDAFMDIAVQAVAPAKKKEEAPVNFDDIITFDDKAFKAFIVRDLSYLDINGDKEISVGEALKVDNLNIKDGNHFLNMKTTSDLRHFTNLRKMEILADVEYEDGKAVYYSVADALDVSMLTKLEDISFHIPLKSLTLGRNEVLSSIIVYISADGMDELDLTGCPALSQVFIMLAGDKRIGTIRLTRRQNDALHNALKDKCETLEINN